MTARTPADVERRMLDYARAAAYLGISVRAVKELAKDGQVAKTLIGSRVLFDKVDLDTFIERVKRAS